MYISRCLFWLSFKSKTLHYCYIWITSYCYKYFLGLMPTNELYICILVKFHILLFIFSLILIMIPSVIDIFDVSIAFHHVTISNNYTSYMWMYKCVFFFSQHSSTISLESLAVIIAQLLSLSMGIPYDDINKCHCPGDVCIMNPAAV